MPGFAGAGGFTRHFIQRRYRGKKSREASCQSGGVTYRNPHSAGGGEGGCQRHAVTAAYVIPTIHWLAAPAPTSGNFGYGDGRQEVTTGQYLVIIQQDGVDATVGIGVVIQNRVGIAVTIGIKPPEPDGFAVAVE